jgi:preprotein translocase subunit SecG
MKILFMILLGLMAVFMILLILIQRGRGGGLVGALGGMGGQSAFGTKAGDLFTRVTMWTAFFWIVLAAGTVKYLSSAGAGGVSGEFGKNQPKPRQTIESGGAASGESGSGGASGNGSTADE